MVSDYQTLMKSCSIESSNLSKPKKVEHDTKFSFLFNTSLGGRVEEAFDLKPVMVSVDS